MTRPTRPPIDVGYLERIGPPDIVMPATGIIAVVSGDGYETVDMTVEQAEELSWKLQGIVADFNEGVIS